MHVFVVNFYYLKPLVLFKVLGSCINEGTIEKEGVLLSEEGPTDGSGEEEGVGCKKQEEERSNFAMYTIL